MLRQKDETLRGDHAHSRMHSLVRAMNRRCSDNRQVSVELQSEKPSSRCSYSVVQSYITLSDDCEGLVARIQLTGLKFMEIPLDDDLQIIATRDGHTIISPSQSSDLHVKLGDHEL